MAQHMFEAPPRASQQHAGLPASVDGALLSMLSKVPAERPSSAGAAVKQLRVSLGLGSAGDAADVASRGAARAPGARSNGFFFALAVLGIALVLVVWARAREPEPARVPQVQLAPKVEKAVRPATMVSVPAPAPPLAPLAAPPPATRDVAPGPARPTRASRTPQKVKAQSRGDLQF
jgi:hypothetical protein